MKSFKQFTQQYQAEAASNSGAQAFKAGYQLGRKGTKVDMSKWKAELGKDFPRFEQGLKDGKEAVANKKVNEAKRPDYSKHPTAALKTMLQKGVLHPNEKAYRVEIEKELKRRETPLKEASDNAEKVADAFDQDMEYTQGRGWKWKGSVLRTDTNAAKLAAKTIGAESIEKTKIVNGTRYVVGDVTLNVTKSSVGFINIRGVNRPD